MLSSAMFEVKDPARDGVDENKQYNNAVH